MIVQAIVADPQSTGLAHVYVGDEAFVVDAVHVAELGLKSGMPLEDSRVERLRRLAQLTGLKERALHLLAHRPYTEHELRCRLQQGNVTPECVDEVLDWLRSLGYVDDAAFARRWVEVRRQTKGFGPVRLRHELVERGVATEFIEAALAEVSEEEYVESAFEQARQRLERLGEVPEAKARRQIYGFLVRRGFTGNTVARVMRRLFGQFPA